MAALPPATLRPKSIDAVELFRQRLRHGDYELRGIPGERKLASELGISYMSARKVVQALIDKGLLTRLENGRLIRANASGDQRPLQIALVAPAFSSQVFLDMQYQLSEVVAEVGGTVRLVSFVQPSDPVIFEALEGGFDGLFVILPVGAPQLLLDRLAKHRERVVSVWADLSHLGVLSIVNGPARFVGKALDHLMALGHRRVDCFNTLPLEPIVNDRIRHWRMGLDQRGLDGELHNAPTKAFQCSITAAYHVFNEMIQRGLESKAYFCVTTDIARGVLRACHEKGIRVGKDISVCGFSEVNVAKLTVPSITAVETADARAYLKMGVDWIASRGNDWQRPLRLEPDDVGLFVGESTGPA